MIVFLCYKVVRSNAAVAHAHFEIGEITFDYLSVVIPRTGLVCLDAEPEFVDKSIVFIHRQVLWYCDLRRALPSVREYCGSARSPSRV